MNTKKGIRLAAWFLLVILFGHIVMMWYYLLLNNIWGGWTAIGAMFGGGMGAIIHAKIYYEYKGLKNKK